MSDLTVTVIVGPGLRADPDLLRETAEAEFPQLGVVGRVEIAADAAAVAASLEQIPGALVVLPGDDPATRELLISDGPHAARTVWYDLTRTGPVPVAGDAVHLYGRGVWGLCWAIRHAVHRLRRPARRFRYGPDPEQWAELRLPRPRPGGDPPPVAVLLHGGFWRSQWAADLMDALAIDLADRGYAAWNLEYRRPDQHGWAATAADVAAGIAALSALPEFPDRPDRLDLDRVAVLGHSAGGQLALRAAADSATDGPVRVAVAVSLAGVVDLVEAQRRWLGTGAVAAALGGTPEQVPAQYAAADPAARLPLRVPQLIVQGRQDDPDLVDLNRRYAESARSAGDRVTVLESAGDHFSVIDPAAPIWHTTFARLAEQLEVKSQ
ncbi:alpha/beta hydrolase [Natronosporangium hydrolyticum]|uniref:Alpha/beta hydrolase n=2 Tax=Natronosporangium hydrolyticum TaxID=2811111 RepID=A0A895YPC2_9ACTN|nr:alpha/beta hydrolase [Natronosporangium hydrolyticum]